MNTLYPRCITFWQIPPYRAHFLGKECLVNRFLNVNSEHAFSALSIQLEAASWRKANWSFRRIRNLQIHKKQMKPKLEVSVNTFQSDIRETQLSLGTSLQDPVDMSYL